MFSISSRLVSNFTQFATKNLHKALGTSSTSEIVDIATKISHDIVAIRAPQKGLCADDVYNALTRHLDKKSLSNIEIITDTKKISKILKEMFKFNDDECGEYLNSCTAVVIPNCKNSKNYLFLPQDLLTEATPHDVSIIAHEIEHTTYVSKSLYLKLVNITEKLFSNFDKKFIKINDDVYNATIEKDYKLINEILDKSNLMTLVKLLLNIKDESRAYSLEDNIFNFIKKHYFSNINKPSYSANFIKTNQLIKEKIITKYLSFIPSKVANNMLNRLN